MPELTDNRTGASVVVLLSNYYTLIGRSWTLSDSVTIPAANDYEIRMQTPDNNDWTHVEFEATSDASLTITLFEDTRLVDVPANRLTPYNRNRRKSVNSDFFVCHTPTGSGDGTELWQKTVGANHPLSGGGSTETRRDWILKRNTAYLVRLAGAENDVVNYTFDWYEDNKEK